MIVYVLSEEYHHYVDGSWSTLIDIYQVKDDADNEAIARNESEGYSREDSGRYFSVEEKELK